MVVVRDFGMRWLPPLAVLTIVAIALTDAASPSAVSPFTGEPVCENFEPFYEGVCTVDWDGNPRGTCKKCLVGAKWDQLRRRLGTGLVAGKRSQRPVIVMNDWKTHELLATVLRIITEEMLGYEPVVVSGSYFQRLDEVLSPGCQGINLEVWSTEVAKLPLSRNESASVAYRNNLVEMKLGATGREGMYIPAYTSFVAGHYEGLQRNLPVVDDDGEISRPLDMFPIDGTYGPDELTDLGMTGPDFGCTAEDQQELGWTKSTCTTGRWYPSICGEDFPNETCREAYMGPISWSSGEFEAVINNNGLPFSAVYTDRGSAYFPLLSEKFERQEDMLYYLWEPNAFHLKHPGRRLLTPESRDECIYPGVERDPRVSPATCGAPPMDLTKWMNEDLMAAEPDLKALLQSMQFSQQDLYTMLSLEQDGGGFLTAEDAACEFLKGEKSSEQWAAWLQIGNPCIGLGGDYVYDEDSMACVKATTLMPLFIATAVLASLLALLAILLCCRQMAMRKYMTEMEEQLFGEVEEHGFENPVEQAVRLMRVVATRSKITQAMQQEAITVAHNLLVKDLYTPIVVQSGLPVDVPDGSQNNDPKPNVAAALGRMVDFISMSHGVSLSNDVGKSKSGRSFKAFLGSSGKMPIGEGSKEVSCSSWDGSAGLEVMFGSNGRIRRALGGSDHGCRISSKRSDSGTRKVAHAGDASGQPPAELSRNLSLCASDGSSTNSASTSISPCMELWKGMKGIETYSDAFIAAELSSDPFLANLGRSLLQNTLLLPDKVQSKPLFVSSMFVLKQHGFLKGDTPARLMRFLAAVEQGYETNPYHNACHAADVLCRLSAMLHHDGLFADGTNRTLLLSSILAAIIHDYAHPGKDNLYQIQEDTEVSRKFNQQMVLENNSLYHCLEMLRQPETDALKDLGVTNRAGVIDTVIKLVLATDMSQHFTLIGDFNSKVVKAWQAHQADDFQLSFTGAAGQSTRTGLALHGPNRRFSLEKKAGAVGHRQPPDSKQPAAPHGSFIDYFHNKMDDKLRVLTMGVALKIADIGNAYTPYGIHCAWGVLLANEFVTQGQAELDAGREPGLLKHPHKPGVDDAANQVAFFNVIVVPMVKAWASCFGSSGNELMAQASNNLVCWERLSGNPILGSMKSPNCSTSTSLNFPGGHKIFEVQRSATSNIAIANDNSVRSRSARFFAGFQNSKAAVDNSRSNNLSRSHSNKNNTNNSDSGAVSQAI